MLFLHTELGQLLVSIEALQEIDHGIDAHFGSFLGGLAGQIAAQQLGQNGELLGSSMRGELHECGIHADQTVGVRHVQQTADRLTQSVGNRGACAADGHTGQSVGQNHLVPSFVVSRIVVDLGQILNRQAHGLQREHLADGVTVLGDEGLKGMEQSVAAGAGNQMLGQSCHEVGVDDGNLGEDQRIHQTLLIQSGVVGEDGGGVAFAASTCGGGEADDGQSGGADTLCGDVVKNVAFLAGHESDALGGVHCAAAAQTDDQITLLFCCEISAFANRGSHGICFRLGKYFAVHTGLGQQTLNSLGKTVKGLTGVGDQQGLLAQSCSMGTDLLSSALAEQVLYGIVKHVLFHICPPVIVLNIEQRSDIDG